MVGGQPTFADSDPGDEFSNNLFSDLAPILALFGEQVAMQFMAESMSWADSIIFSMAPIGVLTAVVGAIRVGGGSWLKALIGRAKENIAVAESELMSSTSGEVCEVFNGRHVVRLMGKPSIKELIFMEGGKGSFKTLSEAINEGLLIRKGFSEYPALQPVWEKIKAQELEISSRLGGRLSNIGHILPQAPAPSYRDPENLGGSQTSSRISIRTKIERYFRPKPRIEGCGDDRGTRTNFKDYFKPDQLLAICGNVCGATKKYLDRKWPAAPGTDSNRSKKDVDRLSEEPPNISLNIHLRNGRSEIHFVAAMGVIFQLGVLVFDWFITYHPDFKQKKGGRDVRSYAFPLTCMGTLVLVAGVFVCSYIIESATTAEIHRLNRLNSKVGAGDLQMLWIQQGGSVNDQIFDSYLIMARKRSDHVITSRRRGRERGSRKTFFTSILTTTGAVVAITGFVLQFVGLRSMTWYASISQLIATIAMIILRAYIRRGLSKSPWAVAVPKDHEIDWLATRTSNDKDRGRLLGRRGQAAEGQAAEGQAAEGQGRETRGHWWSLLLGIQRKNGALYRPWNDSKPDGFWKMGSFGWEVRSVVDSDFNRYQELKKLTETSETESASMKTIKARIDLRSKTGWSGPALEQAVRVASAIEAFMNAFFPKDLGVENLVWSISNAPASKAPASDAPVDDITFNLSLKDSVWKADVAQIEAFLSLWLFSVSEKESQAVSSKIQQSIEGGLSGTASRNHSLRLLALGNPSILQCMYWWLGSAVALVKEVKIKSPIEKLPPAPAVLLPTATGDLDLGTPQAPGTDAFEIELSTPKEAACIDTVDANREIRVTPNDCGSKSPSTIQSIKFERHRVLGYYEKSLCDIEPVLGVISDAPLDVLYAQELFSAFIWSFAQCDSVKFIQGSTKLMPLVQEMDECGRVFFESITLEHKELNRVVENISRSGLGSVEDIMLSVIPPLMMKHKLPDMSAVIHSIRERGRVQESYHRWQEAGELYLWGFMAFRPKYMGMYQTAIEQATCALTEFMRELTLEINMTEQFREQKYHRFEGKKFQRTQELIGLRKKITKALKKYGNGDVLIKINQINIWQKRAECSQEWQEWLYSLKSPGETDDRSYPDARGFWTKLHNLVAVESNLPEDVNIITKQLKDKSRGVSDPTDFAGYTPLHYAKSKAIAKILLGAGAPITAKGNDGFTPLHNAARTGQKDLVALLIEHGCELNPRDSRRRTPLHWAAYGDHVKVIQILLGKGADPLAVSEHRRNPLHMAASRGNLRAVKMLVVIGKVDINIRDNDGRTALHLAVAGNHAHVISYLSGLRKGWPEDLSGYTAIHLAAFLGDKYFEEAFKAFLEDDQGTEPKRGKEAGQKVEKEIEQKAEQGAKEGIEQEIEKEAEPKPEQETALDAEQETSKETEEKLSQKAKEILNLPTSGRGATVLHVAAQYNKPSVIEFILSLNHAPSIDQPDNTSRTPLMCAAIHGNNSAVKLLLEKGSKVDATNTLGRSALHLAATSERSSTSDVIKTLHDAGADSNLKDKNGLTPLLCAATTGNDTAVEALIPISNIDAVDNGGRTALHLAVAFHLDAPPAGTAPSKRSIKRLLKAGAKTNVQDKLEKFPLEYPVVEELDWLRVYLLENGDVTTIQMEDERMIRWRAGYWNESTDNDSSEDEDEDE